MSQCVPSWNLDDSPPPASTTAGGRHSLRSNSNSTPPDVPMLDYEVAELTWENGQIAMHGLGPPRVGLKPIISSATSSKYNWEKPPRASGTLESIVNQATRIPGRKGAAPTFACDVNNNELVPWFDHATAAATPSATMTMDALVPCSNRTEDRARHVMESVPAVGGTCAVGCSITRVASCSGPPQAASREDNALTRRVREERMPIVGEWSSMDQSVSASATFGSQQITLGTAGRGFTSATSLGSPENTSSGKPETTRTTTVVDDDSVCPSRPQREVEHEEGKKKESGKYSVSSKRSRAAAIHNQSERKRRDKINQRMNTLQKLVPNSNKTDKASMLDEVIDYVKQLQAQVSMMGRMNVPAMMLPMQMQQQLQMSMMGSMGMGMGMGVMDMNSLARPYITGMSPVMPNPFMPMTSWDAASAGDGRLQQPSPASVMPDPLSAFLACQQQSQPMTLDAYSRMAAAMYQQMQQQPATNSKS